MVPTAPARTEWYSILGSQYAMIASMSRALNASTTRRVNSTLRSDMHAHLGQLQVLRHGPVSIRLPDNSGPRVGARCCAFPRPSQLVAPQDEIAFLLGHRDANPRRVRARGC